MWRAMSDVTDANIAVIIPFRDRGRDPRRTANLDVVMTWWWAHGFIPQIVDDGLTGDAQFNRHRAYNIGVSRNPAADVFVFTEADMLIPAQQVIDAMRMAVAEPGLVVPFTQYRYLSDTKTADVRGIFADSSPEELSVWMNLNSPFLLKPESTMDGGKSIGAVNVVSRETLNLTGGFTEATRGNWYDDNITEEGFAFLSGRKTRWVPGPATHLYHLPGHTGEHLTDADRKATEYNKNLLAQVRRHIRLRQHRSVQTIMQHRQDASYADGADS